MQDKEYLEKSSWYTGVANAIRNKKGTSEPVNRDNFADEIESIEAGIVEVIPDGYVKPSGSLDITENGEYNVANYEKANVNIVSEGGGESGANGKPIEVATEEEMNALLDTAPVGGVYRYVGESGTYEKDAMYYLESTKLINFKIYYSATEYVDCTAEEGMSWKLYVNSNYNTHTFFSEQKKLAIMDNGSAGIGSPYNVYVYDEDVKMVEGSSVIVENHEYSLEGK